MWSFIRWSFKDFKLANESVSKWDKPTAHCKKSYDLVAEALLVSSVKRYSVQQINSTYYLPDMQCPVIFFNDTFVSCLLTYKWCHLRTSSTSTLFVQSTCRITPGNRAFPVASAWVWNKMPAAMRTSSPYPAFLEDLKMFLFNAFFDDWQCVTWCATYRWTWALGVPHTVTMRCFVVTIITIINVIKMC